MAAFDNKESTHNDRPRGAAGDSYASDDLDLARVLGELVDNRWLILAVTATVLGLGAIYALTATPVYKADALLQVEHESPKLGEVGLMEQLAGDTSADAEIQILSSRLVLGDVVENLLLDVSAEADSFPLVGNVVARLAGRKYPSAIRVESLDVPDSLLGVPLTLVSGQDGSYSIFTPDDQEIVRGSVGISAVGSYANEPVACFLSVLSADVGDAFVVTRDYRLKAIDDLRGRLQIAQRGKGSGIIVLSLKGKDRSHVSETLNEIANVYVRKHVERKSAEAEKTLAFLEQQLPIVKLDMETAEEALNTYRLAKGSVDLPIETQGVLETILEVEAQLNELRRERESVLQRFTAEHPMALALIRQIETLNREIEELNAQVRDLPGTQQEILRLVRDAEVNTALYTSLLNTAQELRVVKAGTIGSVRIIDKAVAPYEPVAPNIPLILAISLLGGLFLGILAVYLRRALQNGVQDPDYIEFLTEAPVLATVPHSKRQAALARQQLGRSSRTPILALVDPRDTAIESLRSLRTALRLEMDADKANSIMVTSPRADAGKTFISVNLAVVLARIESKVLLIDADLRRGHTHEYFGGGRANGLSDLASGNANIEQVLRSTDVDGLTYIATGTLPDNPDELLENQRFAEFLQSLGPRYDHIIIDSPPILAGTDSAIVGQKANTILMVLKSGEHSETEIEISAKRLRQGGARLRGVILNDIRATSGYAKYGAYQYR